MAARNPREVIIRRYFDVFGKFVDVRRLDNEEIGALLKGFNGSPEDYMALVVDRCLVSDYGDVVPSGFSTDEAYLHLYDICTAINPEICLEKVELRVQPYEGELRDRIRESLGGLEREFNKRVIGQSHVIGPIKSSLERYLFGLSSKNKPLGVFVLAGRTGTGKTETAKALSDIVYGGEDKLVRVDCSEYVNSHDSSRLTGSPPGYVGYSDDGILKRNFSGGSERVLLVDEVEKAHRKTLDLFYQIIDEGRLTLGDGTEISFDKSLILMTSNLGTEQEDSVRNRIGFSDCRLSENHLREIYVEAIRDRFGSALFGRIGEQNVLVYNPIDKESAFKIVKKNLRDKISLLRENLGISARATSRAVREIAELSDYKNVGGRDILRLIEQEFDLRIIEAYKRHGRGRYVFRFSGGRFLVEKEK